MSTTRQLQVLHKRKGEKRTRDEYSKTHAVSQNIQEPTRFDRMKRAKAVLDKCIPHIRDLLDRHPCFDPKRHVNFFSRALLATNATMLLKYYIDHIVIDNWLHNAQVRSRRRAYVNKQMDENECTPDMKEWAALYLAQQNEQATLARDGVAINARATRRAADAALRSCVNNTMVASTTTTSSSFREQVNVTISAEAAKELLHLDRTSRPAACALQKYECEKRACMIVADTRLVSCVALFLASGRSHETRFCRDYTDWLTHNFFCTIVTKRLSDSKSMEILQTTSVRNALLSSSSSTTPTSAADVSTTQQNCHFTADEINDIVDQVYADLEADEAMKHTEELKQIEITDADFTAIPRAPFSHKRFRDNLRRFRNVLEETEYDDQCDQSNQNDTSDVNSSRIMCYLPEVRRLARCIATKLYDRTKPPSQIRNDESRVDVLFTLHWPKFHDAVVKKQNGVLEHQSDDSDDDNNSVPRNKKKKCVLLRRKSEEMAQAAVYAILRCESDQLHLNYQAITHNRIVTAYNQWYTMNTDKTEPQQHNEKQGSQIGPISREISKVLRQK